MCYKPPLKIENKPIGRKEWLWIGDNEEIRSEKYDIGMCFVALLLVC